MNTATVPRMMELVQEVRSAVATELAEKLDKEIIQDCLFPNLSPRASTPAPLADICRRKHKGHERSEAANRLVHATKKSARERIYSLIAASAGITLKEIAAKFGKQIHQISGRISELKKANRIYETGAVREGCAVLKAVAQ